MLSYALQLEDMQEGSFNKDVQLDKDQIYFMTVTRTLKYQGLMNFSYFFLLILICVCIGVAFKIKRILMFKVAAQLCFEFIKEFMH